MYKYKKYGFTIVELVVVLLVIAILSAVALPRIVNLGKQARQSTVLAMSASLKTAVELARSQWISSSEPANITIDNIYFWMGEGVTARGWPQNVSSAAATTQIDLTPNECLRLWNSLLKSPPLASITSGCTADNTCKFLVTSSGVDLCEFTDKDSNFISYNRASGEVTYTMSNP